MCDMKNAAQTTTSPFLVASPKFLGVWVNLWVSLWVKLWAEAYPHLTHTKKITHTRRPAIIRHARLARVESRLTLIPGSSS